MDLQRMMLLYINAVPNNYKSPLGVFSQRAFTIVHFSISYYMSVDTYIFNTAPVLLKRSA